MTLQEAGYGQANLVEDIVSRLSAQLQYQANLVEEETAPPPSDHNGGRNRHGGRPPATGPRTGQLSTPLPTTFNKYCWTHVRCNHNGAACNNKASGHKDTATLINKLGGSTYACVDA